MPWKLLDEVEPDAAVQPQASTPSTSRWRVLDDTPTAPSSSSLSDVGHAAAAGVWGGAGDLAEGVTAPFTGKSNTPAEWLHQKEQAQLRQISPAARQEMAKPIFTGEGLSDIGVNQDLTGTGLLLKSAQGIGSLAPSMIPGGLATKGLGVLTKVDKLRRAATVATDAAKASGIVDEAALKALPEVMKLKRAEDLAAAGGFGVTTGVMQAGSAADTARAEMLKRGGTPEQAEQAARTAALIAGGVGLVSGAAGGPIESKLLNLTHGADDVGMKFGEKLLRRTGMGAGVEVPQEFVESGSEQAGVNVGVGDPWSKQVPQQAGEGGLIGGITGGLGGAGSAMGAQVGNYLTEPLNPDFNEPEPAPSDVKTNAPPVDVGEFTPTVGDQPAATALDPRIVATTNQMVDQIEGSPAGTIAGTTGEPNASYPPRSPGRTDRPTAGAVDLPPIGEPPPAPAAGSPGGRRPAVAAAQPPAPASERDQPADTGRVPHQLRPALNQPQEPINGQPEETTPQSPAAANQPTQTGPDQAGNVPPVAQGAGSRPEGRPERLRPGRRPDTDGASVPVEETYLRSYDETLAPQLALHKVSVPVTEKTPGQPDRVTSMETDAREALDNLDQRYNFARRLLLCLGA